MSDQPTSSLNLVEAYSQLEPEYLIICTYTLGLGYIEQKFLNQFKEKYNTKILVITSASGLSQSFDDAFALRGAGTNYLISGVNDHPFAFHPKILLAIDRHKGPLLFVTGCNFTYPGMSLNLDAVEQLDLARADDQTLQNVKVYLQMLQHLIITDEQKKILTIVDRLLPKASENPDKYTFLHNFQHPILEQMIAYIGDVITEVKVISPYYDGDMHALKLLIEKTGRASCSILCNHSDIHVNLKKLPEHVRAYSSQMDEVKRYLHAKTYLFKTEYDEHFIAVGSANCTTPGLINIPGQKGNWETVAIRQVTEEKSNQFYQSFNPVEILSENYWDYTQPPKEKNDHGLDISFEAIYFLYDIEIRLSTDNVQKPISGNISFHLGNITKGPFAFTDTFKNANGGYNIDIPGIDKYEGLTCRIELNLDSPVQGTGSTWLIQKQVLARTHHSRQLINKIRDLQDSTGEDWNEFENIVQFIADNIGFVSARPRKLSGSKSSSASRDRVPTINGIIEVNEDLTTHHFTNLNFADYNSIRKSFEQLMEKGFLQLEGENDEDEEDTQPSRRSSATASGTNEHSLRNLDPNKKPKVELPNFGEIIRTKIVDGFNQTLKNADRETISDLYKSLFDSITFSLRLLRFINLELTHRFTDIHTSSADYFVDTRSLLKNLMIWYHNAGKKYGISQRDLQKLMADSELISEVGLLTLEAWVVDINDIIPFELKTRIVDSLRSLINEEDFTQVVTTMLQNSTRFDPGRKNILINSSQIEEITRSMYLFQEEFVQREQIYKKCLKIKYWRGAQSMHQKALEIMSGREPKDVEKIEEHKRKVEKSTEFVELFLLEIEEVLGKNIAHKVNNEESYHTINSIIKDGDIICPKCGGLLSSDDWMSIRACTHILCKGCGDLILPLQAEREYDFRFSSEAEWNKGL